MKQTEKKTVAVALEENSTAARLNLPSYDGNNPFIFISYSHSDTARIRPILSRIAQENFRFWYDENMEAGEDFRDELRTKIERCSAFLLFASKAALASKYCCMEIITAFKNDKKIYPIFLEDNVEIPAALKMILENVQHLKGSLVVD